MDTALAEALPPVLRDLEDSGSVLPEILDDRWGGAEQATAMLYSAGGSGQGVSASIADSLAERVASVADQVQEWAIEELRSLGRPTNWPQCPEHPESHPLAAVVTGDRPTWACPKTGHVICEIGQLASCTPPDHA
jgi:hypothetical protein